MMLLLCVCVLAPGAYSGCAKKEAPPASVAVDRAELELFEPLPEVIPSETDPITEEKVAPGRMLYYEPRLSKSRQISCNSCHMLDKYGVDGEPTSDGRKAKKGDRNSPTVYNAAGHFVQFWDGRAADVEDQAKGPVMNPVEMAVRSKKVVIAVRAPNDRHRGRRSSVEEEHEESQPGGIGDEPAGLRLECV